MAETLYHAHHSSLILHETLEEKPMTNQSEELLKVYLFEYHSLKNEQAQRIGFRDQLLYAMLVAFGGVSGYALGHTEHLTILLVLPWLCFILGWTYVVNDEKISAIGRYLRLDLSQRISTLTLVSVETLLGWETGHRSDPHRKSRKIYQLLVDEIAFVGSGILALVLSLSSIPSLTRWMQIVIGIDALLLLLLAYWMWVYADLQVGSGRPAEKSS
jgi:hypothetical protein